MTQMPDLIAKLRRAVAPATVIDSPAELKPYSADWYTTQPGNPDVAILPTTTGQVAAAVQMAAANGVPVVPRGAGTGLAGGARPLRGGIVICTTQMNQIQRVDTRNRIAQVQPGIINYELSQQLIRDYGYYFAPDPASWKLCTLGGNIANNSGGPHCLKYGVTTNHILGVELVMHDGRVLWTSDGLQDTAGYDLTGLVVGSEGTFGVVTSALIRLTRTSETTEVAMVLFPDMLAASESVSRIVATGLIPTSLEVMDAITIKAVNAAYNYGLPDHAGAALIIEVDGVTDGIDELLDTTLQICRRQGAIDIRLAHTAAEQEHIWAARKSAFEALRQVYPDYYLVDTVVPRTLLPSIIEQVVQIGERYRLPIANVFHAGDGNLHPLVLHDPNNPDEVARTHQIIEEIMHLSIAKGGTISGEHGIGADKQNFMAVLFHEHELQAMAELFAVFNPTERFNPGKVFPNMSQPLELAAERQQRLATARGKRVGDAVWIEELGQALEQAVGAKNLLNSGESVLYTIQGQQPRFVALPTTVEQLSRVMSACHAAGATVVPWGGGSQQDTGLVADKPDVVISVRRLSDILHYNRDDLTISVGAGMNIATLRALLAEQGQMLPFDIPLPERATIGGLVATATSYPRRLRYGSLRDLVLGLTLVEVDGAVSRFGGQVVKNVSGYDMCKLFVGSHGTLGVIASVNLRTLPQSRNEASMLIGFAERKQALAMVDELSHTQLTPTAVEYLDYGAFPQTGAAGECGLAIWLEGSEAVCQRHIRDINRLARRHSALTAYDLVAEDHHELWARITNLNAIHNWSGDEALLQLIVAPAELRAALIDLQECARRLGMTCVCNAQALNGVIFVRASGTARNLQTLQRELVERWQHSHVLACAPDRKLGLALWGAQHPGHDLMVALKQAFDPAHTLNPGRYVVAK